MIIFRDLNIWSSTTLPNVRIVTHTDILSCKLHYFPVEAHFSSWKVLMFQPMHLTSVLVLYQVSSVPRIDRTISILIMYIYTFLNIILNNIFSPKPLLFFTPYQTILLRYNLRTSSVCKSKIFTFYKLINCTTL